MIFPITKNPSAILRIKGEKIKNPLDPDIQNLIQHMIETMRAEKNGVGLAAQQIGHALQLCVIEVDDKIYIMMNPKITSLSREVIVMEEGCLSIPGKFFPVTRPQWVQVRYTNEKGEKKKLRATGLLGRAVQHEVDHLNGILILDRL